LSVFSRPAMLVGFISLLCVWHPVMVLDVIYIRTYCDIEIYIYIYGDVDAFTRFQPFVPPDTKIIFFLESRLSLFVSVFMDIRLSSS
jgi:hypothetical protein